jgi:hypothetical protein
MHRIPNEILCIIFYLTIPPAFLLDSSIYRGPQSSWCLTMATKKALIRVCKQWWHVAMPIFYEDVSLRHMTQLAALVRTVKLPNVGIGSLIRRVDVMCYILPGDLHLFATQLQRLFDQCPNVTRLGYNAITSPEPLNWICTFQHHATLRSLYPRLTHLECGENVDFSNLTGVLLKCSSLQSLTCHLRSPNDKPWPADYEALKFQVNLPKLKALHCIVKYNGKPCLETIASQWGMPNLEHLSVDHISVYNAENSNQSLLRAHGHHLKFLCIQPLCTAPYQDKYVINPQILLQHCPVLEHLVIPPANLLLLSHPRVTWVDVWATDDDDQQSHMILRDSISAAFPALRGVRVLDLNLTTVLDISSMLHPAPFNDGNNFTYEFPGVHIHYSSGMITKIDYMGIDKDEGSSDGDYGQESSN